MIRRLGRLLRWLVTAAFGVTVGVLLGSLRRRPQSSAVDEVEPGPGQA